jgi:hypothetical protein
VATAIGDPMRRTMSQVGPESGNLGRNLKRLSGYFPDYHNRIRTEICLNLDIALQDYC